MIKCMYLFSVDFRKKLGIGYRFLRIHKCNPTAYELQAKFNLFKNVAMVQSTKKFYHPPLIFQYPLHLWKYYSYCFKKCLMPQKFEHYRMVVAYSNQYRDFFYFFLCIMHSLTRLNNLSIRRNIMVICFYIKLDTYNYVQYFYTYALFLNRGVMLILQETKLSPIQTYIFGNNSHGI